jgi:hypothetical protein
VEWTAVSTCFVYGKSFDLFCASSVVVEVCLCTSKTQTIAVERKHAWVSKGI